MYDIIFPWTPKADHRRPQVQGSVTIATGRTFLHEPGFLVCQFAEISVPALNATEQLGFAGAYMMTTDQPMPALGKLTKPVTQPQGSNGITIR